MSARIHISGDWSINRLARLVVMAPISTKSVIGRWVTRLAKWSVDWRVARLINRLAGGWMVDWLVIDYARLAGKICIATQYDELINRSIQHIDAAEYICNQKIETLTDWLIDWLSHAWIISDGLTVQLIDLQSSARGLIEWRFRSTDPLSMIDRSIDGSIMLMWLPNFLNLPNHWLMGTRVLDWTNVWIDWWIDRFAGKG